jgi:hypothetical protein
MKKTGGDAFPRPYAIGAEGSVIVADGGMTLRDYFAAQSIAAVLMHLVKETMTNADVAHLAYEIADAMLEERDK